VWWIGHQADPARQHARQTAKDALDTDVFFAQVRSNPKQPSRTFHNQHRIRCSTRDATCPARPRFAPSSSGRAFADERDEERQGMTFCDPALEYGAAAVVNSLLSDSEGGCSSVGPPA
jgi:hypothetical protein